jgi:hypothetical protein
VEIRAVAAAGAARAPAAPAAPARAEGAGPMPLDEYLARRQR